MIMRVFMRMVWPVLVCMAMHGTGRREFLWCMSMSTLKMVGVIMTTPQVVWVVVGDQQALTVMPAISEDVIILLAFGGLLLLA
jgi:hypothetical protein